MSSNLAPWPYTQRPLLINDPRPVRAYNPVASTVPIVTRQSGSRPQPQPQPQPQNHNQNHNQSQSNQSHHSHTTHHSSEFAQPATDPDLAPWPYGTPRTSTPPSERQPVRVISSSTGRPARVLHLPPTLRVHISSSRVPSSSYAHIQSRQTSTAYGRYTDTSSIYEELPPYPYPHVDSPAYTETQA